LYLDVMAQSGSSTITGTLKDPTGAAVPGAKVRVINDSSGASQDAESNETGAFRAVSLVPGEYRVEVELEGFQKLVRRPVDVAVDQVVALDLVLQMGQASEMVTVTEAAPVTESQTSNVGQTVSRQMLAGLP